MDLRKVQTFVPNPNIPEVAPGDTVQVSLKVVEGERARLQQFRGTVIRVRQGGVGSSFTVRRLFQGVGVERTFPFHSPMVQKVEVLRRAKVRRATLYYLRGRSRKASRLKERMEARGYGEAVEQAVAPETAEVSGSPESAEGVEAPKAE